MRSPWLDRLADVLVNYSCSVKKGDLVSISANPIALPLVEATYEAVLKAGGHPFYRAAQDDLSEILLTHGTEEQLRYLSPIDMHMVETIDVQIGFWAEVNTRAMSRIDPTRSAMRQSVRRPYMDVFRERVAKKELRWVGTLYPTQASAQDAEMSLRQYEAFVFRAGLLHKDDPAAEWREIHERQQRVCDDLEGCKELHFKVPPARGADGTDLRVSVEGGTWINCSGKENFPDGEVFTGPQGVDGHVNYTFPAVYQGREVEGVRLAFRDGRVVDASASKNEAFLIEMLDQDEGARTLGEIAIGTNYAIKEFSRNTLFDEKIGGTFHAAVGAGYPESGNNNTSALHWDMVCELRPISGNPGGEILADGEVLHKDGMFTREGWPGRV